MNDTDPIFTRTFVAEFTADECGQKLAYSHQSQLAVVLERLASRARIIDWPKRCRLTAECLDPDQCDRVRETLETLCERLADSAKERREAERTEVNHVGRV